MPDPTPNARPRLHPALVGVGVLVVIIGFGLPALVSKPAPELPRPSTTAAEALTPRPSPPAPLEQTPASVGAALLRLVLALALVCGGCVFVVRWLGRTPPAPETPNAMTVLASMRVGRCAVHLARLGSRRVLIGTDGSGVKALVELPGPGPADEPPA